MIQYWLVKSYALARRMGLFSSPAGQALFSRAYYLYKRVSEEQQGNLIRRLATSGSLAIDVGANIGYFTILMGEAVGTGGHVLAFEPDEGNLRLLRRAIQRAGATNVTVVPAAAGERTGTITLYTNPDHPGDHRTYPAGAHAKSQEVRLWSLDDFLGAEGPSHDLSLVKIDVQGAELSVLRGLRRTLSRYPQARVLIEFDPDLLRQGGASPGDLAAWLSGMGYRPFLLREGGNVQGTSWADIERMVASTRYIDVLLSHDSIPELARQ